MSTILFVLAVLGYAAVWLTTAVAATRWVADRGRCHAERRYAGSGTLVSSSVRWVTRSSCREFHWSGCWRPDGIVTPVIALVATAAGLAWPLLAPPALVYWAATRKPTPVGLQARIDQLERDLGIGDER